VIARVPRPKGDPLVDTVWAVYAPVYERLWFIRMQSSLLLGQTVQLHAFLVDTSEAMLPIPDTLRARMVWRSNRPDVVRVDERGHVTAVSRGNAVVEASIPSLGVRDTTLVGVTVAADLPYAEWLRPGSGPSDGQLSDVLTSPDGQTLYVYYQRYRTGEIKAFTSDGTELWSRATGRLAVPLRAVGRDGTLYYEERGLHAVRRDGSERWTAPCTGAVALGNEGAVYCADSAAVYAISSEGTVLWRRERPGVHLLAATSRDRIYAAGNGGTVTALSRDGTVLWQRPMQNDGVTALAVDSEGALYLSFWSWKTEALAPDGTVRWQLPGVRGELAIGPDRTLILAREFGVVTAVRLPDGTERWSIRDFTIGRGAPYVGSSGRLYVATDCWVHTLDARTGEVLGRTSEGHCQGYLRHGLVAGRLYLGAAYWQLLTPGEGPGSEWSQPAGNASRSWRVDP
jgi:outer membrane protein assembly factor BamB